METVNIIQFCVFAPLVLFCIGVVGWIAARLFKKETLGNACKCLLSWLTLFFLFPYLAQKAGFIKNKVVGWIIALIAPPLLVLYCLVYGLSTMDNPLPYEKLQFTSKEEIEAITEISNFPEYEYLNNVHDGWNGVTYTRNLFKNENDVNTLLNILKSKIDDEENIYWHKDSLYNKEDREFFGCDEVYICDRGWDSLYVVPPTNIESYDIHVRVVVGKKGFTVKPESCYTGGIHEYAIPDSLYNLTGVRFPKYKIVNCCFHDMFVDWAWDATMKLDNYPSKEFIRDIEKADHWQKKDDGTYEFAMSDRKGDLWERMCVDPKSKIVTISYSTH